MLPTSQSVICVKETTLEKYALAPRHQEYLATRLPQRHDGVLGTFCLLLWHLFSVSFAHILAFTTILSCMIYGMIFAAIYRPVEA